MAKKISKKNKNLYPVLRDLFMIGIGIGLTVILTKSGIIEHVVSLYKDYPQITSFVSGIFFTSIFTIAPASVTLVHIAHDSSVTSVILWGSLGAMFGDMILFFFVKDFFAADVKRFLKPRHIKHIMKSLHLGFMRWLSPIIGALIIASPLPDELGVSLLGMSKIKTIFLIPIAFFMNMLGIYILIEFSKFL